MLPPAILSERSMVKLTEGTFIIATIISGFFLGSAGAQELPVLQAKSDPAPYARLSDAAQVGAARIIVGVVLDSQPVGSQLRLTAHLPQDWESEPICARLLSPDALFEAAAEYDVDPDAAGQVTALAIDVNAADMAILEQRAMDHLALTVARGTCVSDSREFVVASTTWEESDRAEMLSIFVNGQGAARVTAEFAGPDNFQFNIRCERSVEASRVGYDHVCRLAAAELPTGQEVRGRINRRDRFGGIELPADFTVSILEPSP